MNPLRMSFAAVLLMPPTLAGAQPAGVAEAPEEIVVIGRQPGPPLWRVTRDGHVLYVFPYLSPVPKDMIWETDKTATVIAGAQEALGLPSSSASPSAGVLLNPVNIYRGLRLVKRLSKNPEGATLQQVLPPDLYERFAALRARYFPRDTGFDDLRPIAAGLRMVDIIQEEEGLRSGQDILRTIQRLIQRNRSIKHTKIELETQIDGNFRSLADRAETLVDSLDSANELACFEAMLTHMEHGLAGTKLMANAWAQGHANEFRADLLSQDEHCRDLLMASSERQLVVETAEAMNRMWLEAAEKALAANSSTFAILSIGELLDENGLLSQLEAKGYEVKEP